MIKITPKGKKGWVTFSFTPEEEGEVSICGEWNEWQEEAMKMKKSGEFYITKVLPLGQEYSLATASTANSGIATVNSDVSLRRSVPRIHS